MIPKWVEQYIGIPFDPDRKQGQDCWGLVRRVFAEQRRIELPQYDDVDPHNLKKIIRAMKGVIEAPLIRYEKVEVKQLQCFDVILMWGHTQVDDRIARVPIHIGVAVSKRYVLHTEKHTGSVAVPINHYTVHHRIVGIFRYVDCQS